MAPHESTSFEPLPQDLGVLVVNRREGEEIVIDGGVRIRVVKISAHRVRLVFEAPKHIGIYRAEILAEKGGESISLE